MASRSAKAKIILNIVNFILHIVLNIIFYVVVVWLILHVSKTAYNFSYQVFGHVTMEEKPGREIEVQIKLGESTFNIAEKLELNRLIINKYSFYLRAKLTGQIIRPGTYKINTSMNYNEILSVITALETNGE